MKVYRTMKAKRTAIILTTMVNLKRSCYDHTIRTGNAAFGQDNIANSLANDVGGALAGGLMGVGTGTAAAGAGAAGGFGGGFIGGLEAAGAAAL